MTLQAMVTQVGSRQVYILQFLLCYNFNLIIFILQHVAIAITEEMDGNIISVDWEAGAEPPFDQAISNARVVALEMEVFLKMLTVCVGSIYR